jgi:hypothetical protein
MRTAIAAGLSAGLVSLALSAAPGPAAAQSFLQSLFGIGQQPQPQRPMVYPGSPAAVSPRSAAAAGRERYSPVSPSSSARENGDDDDAPRSSGSKYRTVCVRACDGYYFPISNAVPRARFMRDAAQCRSTCGEDARLFYLPSGSDNTSTMLDLAGRSYLRTPNAFKYRKTLIDGCSCRPMPWSETELQRHRQYAADAARALGEPASSGGTKVAAADATASSAERASDGASDTVTVRRIPAEPAPQTIQAADDDMAAPPPAVVPRAVPRQDERPQRPKTAASPARTVERVSGSVTASRRQAAVARVSAPATPAATFGGSWLPTSSAKYTWPGDPPRR